MKRLTTISRSRKTAKSANRMESGESLRSTCAYIVTLFLPVSYFHRIGTFGSLPSFLRRIRTRYNRKSHKNREREEGKKKKKWRKEAKKRTLQGYPLIIIFL